MGTISNCYSIANVTGESRLDALAYGGAQYVINCFWDIETSGQSESLGGTGVATAEMQTATTFLDAGWDFIDETANGIDDIWWIDEARDYPRLWWEKE